MAGLQTGYAAVMEPIPETVRALEELGRFVPTDLLETLRASGDRVREVVPECVGFSLAYLQYDLAFTCMATDEELAVLDGVQYVSGGPCVDSVRDRRVVEFHDGDSLDEQRWQHFAHATAAEAIRSTLTLPIVASGTVVGSVNLYAASSSAFTGHHQKIADIFHAWAPGAVTNADLHFETCTRAQQIPERMREATVTDMAVGILMARHGLDVDEARRRLRDAAERAGVVEIALVATIIDAVGDRRRD